MTPETLNGSGYFILCVVAGFLIYGVIKKVSRCYLNYRLQNLAQRNRQKYLDGYGWAWVAYKQEGLSITEIESYTLSYVDNRGQSSYFDAGVTSAVSDIQQYETVMVLLDVRPS